MTPSNGFIFIPADYPGTPGVYLMKDASGKIIYVGKAKDLRKRLASYFRAGADHTPKTRALVARIASIDLLHVSTEKEALILEAGMIKKHRPRYNVMLMDDKQYVLFELDKGGPFPRLSITRKVRRKGAVHYGPFTSARDARETFRLMGKAFPLRKCSDKAMKNRVRPCLYHHIGQCLAPCAGGVDEERYRAVVRKVEMFLKGRTGELMAELRAAMAAASSELRFEDAAVFRDQIRAVERTVERQAVVCLDGGDRDVVALSPAGDSGRSGLGLGLLFVRQGKLLDEKTFFWPGLTMDEGPEALESFLGQFYGPARFIPRTILLPWPLGDESREAALVEVLSERRGGPVGFASAATSNEKDLVALARSVAARAGKPGDVAFPVRLARALRVGGKGEEGVRRIECVDASHLGGSGMKVGMVVFEDGEPVPSHYRQYNFPDLEGAGDDYAALAGWAERRIASGPPWPDLVLVDGGKGQLGAVARSLAEAFELEYGPESLPMEIASIAKGPSRRAGELEDRIFRPGRSNPLSLKPGGPELLFLQRVRDAAHRYVIGRQRRSRSRDMLRSELLNLPGIGPKTARLLWDRFHSLDEMKRAGIEEVAAVPGVGAKRAKRIVEALGTLKQGRAFGVHGPVLWRKIRKRPSAQKIKYAISTC